jgi:hypothetical protein
MCGSVIGVTARLSAIQDSCLKTRFQSLVFAQLEKDDQKPLWLPDTHIRCVLGDFTLDQLVGAIKLRVQERGGEVVKVSPLELAKRFQQEELLRQDEKRFSETFLHLSKGRQPR